MLESKLIVRKNEPKDTISYVVNEDIAKSSNRETKKSASPRMETKPSTGSKSHSESILKRWQPPNGVSMKRWEEPSNKVSAETSKSSKKKSKAKKRSRSKDCGEDVFCGRKEEPVISPPKKKMKSDKQQKSPKISSEIKNNTTKGSTSNISKNQNTNSSSFRNLNLPVSSFSTTSDEGSNKVSRKDSSVRTEETSN